MHATNNPDGSPPQRMLQSGYHNAHPVTQKVRKDAIYRTSIRNERKEIAELLIYNMFAHVGNTEGSGDTKLGRSCRRVYRLPAPV